MVPRLLLCGSSGVCIVLLGYCDVLGDFWCVGKQLLGCFHGVSMQWLGCYQHYFALTLLGVTVQLLGCSEVHFPKAWLVTSLKFY